MRTDGTTILLTGGGIGRALAGACVALGLIVIMAGRRRAALEGVVDANPGLRSAVLDVGNPAVIPKFAGGSRPSGVEIRYSQYRDQGGRGYPVR